MLSMCGSGSVDVAGLGLWALGCAIRSRDCRPCVNGDPSLRSPAPDRSAEGCYATIRTTSLGGRCEWGRLLVRGFRMKLLTLGILLLGFTFLVGECAAAPRRPLVFIPGILGSRLVDAKGSVVWGNRSSLLNYAQLDLFPGSPGSSLKADGLITDINVLGPFWTIHAYDSLIARLHRLGYVDGKDLFTFPYDWRQSNFETAKLFAAFVDSTPALRAGKFDIVAHSMGGLVTKIWLIDGGGAGRVNKVIYMGTPFRGSMNAFATLSDGWGAFANFVAGGLSTVRRVSLSFPALYELFPTYDNCCRLGDPKHHTPLDIFSPLTWSQRDWLPAEYAAGGPRAALFERGLMQARKIGAMMRIPIPNVEEIRFAGDVIDTKLWLYVPQQNQSWKNWKFTESRGDGTVLVWSAANNFNGTEGSEPSFVEHATIFADKWLGDKLDRELVPDTPPPVRSVQYDEVATPSGSKKLTLAAVELDPPVASPGEKIRLHISLQFDSPVKRGDVTPSARLISQQRDISLVETTTDADAAVRRVTFDGELQAPAQEDTHQIDVNLPGAGTRASYITVFEASRRQP
jgi:pimeloyl-ACP methyl ester carboxylesterase